MTATVWSDHDGDALFDSARPEWQHRGACRGLDPNLFFPERGESVKEAKAVCARCPVRAECLKYALENHELHGIWGGFSERERRQLRRQRRLKEAA
jgi:WhiB family redox-sensing transcriptional regulator